VTSTAASLPFSWRLRVAGTVLVLPPLLHVVSLHRVANRLTVREIARAQPPIPPLVNEVDRWLTRLPWLWRTTCLKRAGVLYALLRKGGVEVELHIGVKRDDSGALAAHAWLMKGGAPYLEHPSAVLASYQVIARFPESTPTA